MGPINFILMFAICFALALFSIENPQMTVIHIVPGYDIQAPLSLELIAVMGIGAILAWCFGIWSGLQQFLANARTQRQLRAHKQAAQRQVLAKETEVAQLKEDIEHWKAEVDKQTPILSAAPETQTAEVISS